MNSKHNSLFCTVVLPAFLAATVLCISIPCPVHAESTVTLEEYLAEKPEEDRGIRREKYYLLEAMERIQDIGLSPIGIWSEITGNEKVENSLHSLKDFGRSAADTVTETVTEKTREAGETAAGKAEEAGSAVAEKAKDTIQDQAEKAKESFLEKIREWFHSQF